MRVVEMDPHENRSVVLLSQPLECLVDDGAGTPLVRLRHARAVADGIAVMIKALIQAAIARDDRGTDERRCAKPVRLQRLRQSGVLGSQRSRVVVAKPVGWWEESRENARMRRQGQRRYGNRLIEDHAFAGESIESGHRRAHVPIRRESVRSSGVERDQKNRA